MPPKCHRSRDGLTAQLVMGLLLGGIGVTLAVPLFAAILVLVKMLYIEDTLGERT